MEYVLNAYVILTSVVTIASIVANYTDTPKDDAAIKKLYDLLEMFAFLKGGKAKQP
jgi:hypothetical protein